MAEENTATSTVNQVLQKKIDGYHFESENFLAPQELTVTITLGEYRKLLKETATASDKISAADRLRYSAQEERDKAKMENERLRAELDEVKGKLHTATVSVSNLQQSLDASETELEALKAEVTDLKSKLPKGKK